MRIYFAQFNTIWSLDVNAALKVCDLGIEGKTWNFDKLGRRLKKKVRYLEDTHTGRAIPTAAMSDVYFCLDYEQEDWERTKADIEARVRERYPMAFSFGGSTFALNLTPNSDKKYRKS